MNINLTSSFVTFQRVYLFHIGYSQVLAILVNLCCLCETSLTHFFSARAGEERESNPSKTSMLTILPIVLTNPLSSIVLSCSGFVLFRGFGFLAVMLIVILNCCVGRTLGREAIVACEHVRRTLGGTCFVHSTLEAVIRKDGLMIIAEILLY